MHAENVQSSFLGTANRMQIWIFTMNFVYFLITSSDEKLKLALVVVNMPLGGMADKFFHLWNTGKASALQLINLFLTWSLIHAYLHRC